MTGFEENLVGKGSILKQEKERDMKERQAKSHKAAVTGANFEIGSILIKSLNTEKKRKQNISMGLGASI